MNVDNNKFTEWFIVFISSILERKLLAVAHLNLCLVKKTMEIIIVTITLVLYSVTDVIYSTVLIRLCSLRVLN